MTITARPPSVRIDDLAEPRFDDDVRSMMDAAAPLGAAIDLTTEPLLAQARDETGLSDGADDPALHERIDVLLGALRDEAGLSAFGRLTTWTQLVQLLKNRLLVHDLLARHPEIHEVEIVRPIVIAGLPRTGTTHLHNLLGADPRLRSLPYWESLEPLPSPDDVVEPGATDPRIERTEAGLAFLERAAPLFKRMHEMTVDHVHEEIQLLAIDFSSMLFETTAPMCSWRDYFLAHDQTVHYEYMKTVLKALTWLRGGDRWVLKSPQHIEQLGPLLATFPDASIVLTHRDPVAVTVSMCTMIAYTARLHLERVDPTDISAYWADRIGRMLRACVNDHDDIPTPNAIDITFDEFMRDDIATIERIYQFADQPLEETSRQAIVEYRDTHPRGRHGGIDYDVESLGLDPARLRGALDFYVERFLGG